MDEHRLGSCFERLYSKICVEENRNAFPGAGPWRDEGEKRFKKRRGVELEVN